MISEQRYSSGDIELPSSQELNSTSWIYGWLAYLLLHNIHPVQKLNHFLKWNTSVIIRNSIDLKVGIRLLYEFRLKYILHCIRMKLNVIMFASLISGMRTYKSHISDTDKRFAATVQLEIWVWEIKKITRGTQSEIREHVSWLEMVLGSTSTQQHIRVLREEFN